MEQDTNMLAAIFQTIITDTKKASPLIHDFIDKSHKLDLQLQSTILVFNAFNESLVKIVRHGSQQRKGSSHDILEWMKRVTEHQNAIKQILVAMTKVLSNGLFNLRLKTEEKKNKIKLLEKTHHKEYKTVKSDLRRKKEVIDKLKKKMAKENCFERQNDLERKSQDLKLKSKLFENQEKQAVRRACLEDRGLYIDLASFIKQILKKERDLLLQSSHAEESIVEINGCIDNSHDIPDDIMNGILESNNNDLMEFNTPATSVNGSLRGSRCNSFSSLNTSRPSSPLCIVEDQFNRSPFTQRGGSMRCDKKRRSQMPSFGSTPLNEGISSVFANPYYSQQPTMPSDITEPSFTKQSHCARGQSCSPSRHDSRHSDNKYLFSTVRRTRSPFRKQNQDQSISIGTSKRPPLPKKFMHTAGVFEQPIDKLEVSNYTGCQQWLPQSQLTSRVANNSTIGYQADDGLSIVKSGAVRAVNKTMTRHLWSDAILPGTRLGQGMVSVSGSVTSEDRKPAGYTSIMSDNLIKTLDSLSLSSDQYVQGR